MNKASQSEGPILQILSGEDGRESPLLRVDAGGSCVLVGPAGSGKTQLLEALVTGRRLRTARLRLFGQPCEGLGRRARVRFRRRLGVVFQDLRLVDGLSAFDNVALAARAIGRPLSDYRTPVGELLAWVGLARRANEPAEQLPPESRRRLALARALINSPELLIADEPTEGLTDKPRNSLLHLIGEVHAAGTAVLLATRDADLAQASGGAVLALERQSS